MRKAIILLIMMIFLAINVYAELNPSAVYCEAMGYEYTTNITPTGGQIGICILPDGTSVEAWDFLKGKVGKEHSYCEKEGYTLKTISDSPKCFRIYSQECAVCVKEDGEEIEVTKLMNLNFDESICGDGVCTALEDFLGCPEDCPSGFGNGYCDGLNDGRCDPDCIQREDPDCPDEDELRRFETPDCTDGDGVCYSECVDKDSDCELANASGFGYGNVSPESGQYPKPESKIECIYDGICYEGCIGTDDIDCICIDVESEECKKALGLIQEKEQLDTCGNEICDNKENYQNCPQDCPSGAKDNYCDRIEDNKCDPDCTREEDTDCLQEIQEIPSEEEQREEEITEELMKEEEIIEKPTEKEFDVEEKPKKGLLLKILLVIGGIILIIFIIIIINHFRKKPETEKLSIGNRYNFQQNEHQL